MLLLGLFEVRVACTCALFKERISWGVWKQLSIISIVDTRILVQVHLKLFDGGWFKHKFMFQTTDTSSPYVVHVLRCMTQGFRETKYDRWISRQYPTIGTQPYSDAFANFDFVVPQESRDFSQYNDLKCTVQVRMASIRWIWHSPSITTTRKRQR